MARVIGKSNKFVEGLISVPIDSRPRQSELKPYLPNIQAHVLQLAARAVKQCDDNPNVLAPLKEDLLRLVTALSTDTEYVRVPVLWAMWKSLSEKKSLIESRIFEEEKAVATVEDINNALGVFLSHFDLADHLTEAYSRKVSGDDQVDTAFFHELESRIEDFDSSRKEVFANEVERAKRLSSVLKLPSGVVPRLTYFSVVFMESFARAFGRAASVVAVIASLYLLVDTSGLLESALEAIKVWVSVLL